jgi:hypothetical protein
VANATFNQYRNGIHDGRQKKPPEEIDVEGLYSKIGRLEMENDFLKKNLQNYRPYIKSIIVPNNVLSLLAQCRLLGVPHSMFYYHPVPVSSSDLDLLDRFDRFHFEHPSFGSRRLGVQFGISRAKSKRLR